MRKFVSFLILFALSLQLSFAGAPTTGQFLFQRKSAGGPFDQFGVTPVAGQAFGWDGSNVVSLSLSNTATWGSITGTLSNQTDLQSALTGKQPLNSDLTALSGINSTAYGRSLLTPADAPAARTLLGLGTLATQSGTFSGTSSGVNTGDQTTITGNAGTATKLQTARNINGVAFDGSADITVTAAAGTLTGDTLASGVTTSSLTSVGTLSGLTVSGNAAFNGTANTAANQTAATSDAIMTRALVDIRRDLAGPRLSYIPIPASADRTSSTAASGATVSSSLDLWLTLGGSGSAAATQFRTSLVKHNSTATSGTGPVVNFTLPHTLGGLLLLPNDSSVADQEINFWFGQTGSTSGVINSFGIVGGYGFRCVRADANNFRIYLLAAPASAVGITGATNASPIVITQNAHGYQTGQTVAVVGVGGNTAANGTFTVGAVTTNTFELSGSTGSGAYTSGGTTVRLVDGGTIGKQQAVQWWITADGAGAYSLSIGTYASTAVASVSGSRAANAGTSPALLFSFRNLSGTATSGAGLSGLRLYLP